MMELKPGYSMEALRFAIEQMVSCGQSDIVRLCFKVEVPRKEVSRVSKLIRALDGWMVQDDVIWNAYGLGIHGIASWAGVLTILSGDREHRFRILHLDRFGKRFVFAIPARQAESISELPGIGLSISEIRVLIELANDLADSTSQYELYFKLKHPSQNTLIQQRENWPVMRPDENHLLTFLESTPTILSVIVAAMDSQLRAFKRFGMAPHGLYNFLLPKGTSSADEWLLTAFRAVSFVNEPGAVSIGPIEITLKDGGDLARWRACYERLAILRTTTGALLWPLMETAEETERLRKCGGCPSNPFPTVPIAVTRGILQCPQALDVSLPDHPNRFCVADQDLLRTAMATLLNKELAQKVYDRWRKNLETPLAYRIDGFRLWRDTLIDVAINSWFSNPETKRRALALLEQDTLQQEADEARRAETLEHAFQLLSNPGRYDGQIIDRPNSKDEAQLLLSADAVAFRFTPQRGPDKGHTYLAFNEVSLQRLLRCVGCTESLFESFLRLCEKEGILDQRNRSITLGGETFNAITFRIQT